MKKFRLVLHQPVYHNGTFSHNVERILQLYAPSAGLAIEFFEQVHRKESGVVMDTSKLRVTNDREHIASTYCYGDVEYDVKLHFMDDAGRVITPTNTLSTVAQIINWLVRLYDEDGADHDQTPFKIEIDEKYHKTI